MVGDYKEILELLGLYNRIRVNRMEEEGVLYWEGGYLFS